MISPKVLTMLQTKLIKHDYLVSSKSHLNKQKHIKIYFDGIQNKMTKQTEK
jgi:hypothetical protein